MWRRSVQQSRERPSGYGVPRGQFPVADCRPQAAPAKCNQPSLTGSGFAPSGAILRVLRRSQCRHAQACSAGPALGIEPPPEFHDEHVIRSRAAEVTQVTAQTKVAAAILDLALLLPDEKQRRARTPLPPEHRAASQRSRGERLILDLELLARTGTIGVDDEIVPIARDRAESSYDANANVRGRVSSLRSRTSRCR